VLATGISQSVGDLCRVAFGAVGIDDWEAYTVVRTHRLRQVEPDALVGDASKAAHLLSWEPQTSFTDLVTDLVQHDIDRFARQAD
jgi:GDPmannose 4,6-dehydratase